MHPRKPRRRQGGILAPAARRSISPRSGLALLGYLILTSCWITEPAFAVTATVPDTYPTIQAALDAWPDSVLVRPGAYPETLVVANWDFVLSGLVAPGAPADSLPVISGLVFPKPVAARHKAPYITISNVHFSGAVRNEFRDFEGFNDLGGIVLSHCVLDAGIDDALAAMGGQLEYVLRSCTIHGGALGAVYLVQPERGSIESCDVMSRITFGAQSWSNFFTMENNRLTNPRNLPGVGVEILYAGENASFEGNTFDGYDVSIQLDWCPETYLGSNTFIGPGHYGVSFTGLCCYSGAYVSHNSFTGYDVGVGSDAYNGANFKLGENRIEHCGTAGVRIIGAETVEMDRDTILSCGAGAILSAGSPSSNPSVVAQGNVILSCPAATGLSIEATGSQISGNVVGRCGGDGISARCSWPSRIGGNTSFLNAGTGYALTLASTSSQVDHNISYGNARHGIELTTSDSVTVTCNDWFANAAGAMLGAAPSPTDLSVEPMFCDTSKNDAHLALGSELANAPGCGLIGALGIGCDSLVTPVLVDQFTALRDPAGRVVIAWRIHGDFGARVRVERAEHSEGPWVRLAGTPEVTGELFTLVDPDAEGGRAYWYRLIEEDPVQGAHVVATTLLDVTTGIRSFALEPIGGNPGPGPFLIRFGVATPSAVDLQVFDLLGRRVAQLASGAWPAGSHEVRWSGRDASGRFQAGVCLVRYRYPGGLTTRRLVLIR